MVFRFFLITMLFLSSGLLFGQSSPGRMEAKNAISAVMADQEAAWNAGDIVRFMTGYWQSDSLRFIGRSGLTTGWQATLDGYKKSYPGKEGMGTLRFEILSTEMLNESAALVIGKYFLVRNQKEESGIFSLTWKKQREGWKIIADHTSSFSK
jgi:hypothetical protein